MKKSGKVLYGQAAYMISDSWCPGNVTLRRELDGVIGYPFWSRAGRAITGVFFLPEEITT